VPAISANGARSGLRRWYCTRLIEFGCTDPLSRYPWVLSPSSTRDEPSGELFTSQTAKSPPTLKTTANEEGTLKPQVRSQDIKDNHRQIWTSTAPRTLKTTADGQGTLYPHPHDTKRNHRQIWRDRGILA
jgi:hypothetical protein